MPFTPSHAVVALPFVRSPLIPAAIAVGAMSPDLPLFVRGLPLHYGRTHDLLWLPATMLIALALLLIWRCLLRPAVRELSPEWLAARLPDSWDDGAADSWRETFAVSTDAAGRRRGSWTGIAILVVSLALGVISHIVWDLFTHEGRWGVAVIPALDQEWGPLTGYKWLQHGSSIFGLVVIGIWALVWITRRGAAARLSRILPAWTRVVWWISLPMTLAVAWIGGLVVFGPLDAEFTVAHLAYRVLPPACAIWGAVTIVLAVIIQMLRSHPRRAVRPVEAPGESELDGS